MRANQHDLRRRAANFRFDVVTSASVQLITVAARAQSRARKRTLDKIGGRIQLRKTRHVSFADLTAEHSHIRAQFLTQHDFLSRKRRCSGDVFSRHFDHEPPDYGKYPYE